MNIKESRNNGIWAIILALAALLSASCDLFNQNKVTAYEASFYAQNLAAKGVEFYELKANKLVNGKKCVIWAEAGSGVTKADAKKIADEYDTVIRPRMVDAFSEKDFTVHYNGKPYSFNDILDYANWWIGKKYGKSTDGKLTILLLDIKDGFKNPQTDSYVAGYFFSGDFQQQGKIVNGYFSNCRDMIYIDTYPGLMMKQQQAYATFAHELQHLINFTTSIHIGRNSFQDIWIDEGLSSQAEYLYMRRNPEDKCEWFSKDKNGTIAKGNNFFVWDNHKEEPLSILDDYATVYLFFRWLYLQADAEQKPLIFRDIIASNAIDYRAVTNVASQINPAWADWETLLSAWFFANYAPSDPNHGYKDDSYLQNAIKVTPIGGNSIELYPGEGVYSIINHPGGFTNGGASGSIRYAGLASNGTITDLSPYKGNMLLTFNADTTSKITLATPATGQLTGVNPSVSAAAGGDVPDISRMAGTSGGPYVIDARDLWGREKMFSPADLQPLR